ncbi:MAG: hypothetical protein RQ756_09050 [Flavobacteriaceae bacterium]|nr:hypothetical protein [Flavobacteriaceae bacterium]
MAKRVRRKSPFVVPFYLLILGGVLVLIGMILRKKGIPIGNWLIGAGWASDIVAFVLIGRVFVKSV